MKILMLTSDFPHSRSTIGGGLVVFNWIRALCREHDIYLVSFLGEEDRAGLAETGNYCRKILTVSSRRSRWEKLKSLFLLPRHPFPVAATRTKMIPTLINKLIEEEKIDLVQFNHLHLGQYIKAISPRVQKVIFFPDIVSNVRRQQVRISTGLKKYFYYREWRLSRYWEKWYAIWAGNAFVLSTKDRRMVDSWDIGVKAAVLPIIIDESLFRLTRRKTKEADILFIGALHRMVNIDALKNLKENILPPVIQKYPKIRCTIVGAGPGRKIRRMESENFIVTGRVEDIKPYYRHAAMLAAPLRVAGGIIIKIVQAMAAGIPVIASRTANAGIGARQGVEILLADQPDDFAKKILFLLDNPAAGERIGQAGRDFIRRKFSPERCREKLNRAYEAVGEEKGNGF